MWNGTGHQIKLVLIRHGATKGNERHAYIGKTDEELSKTGIQVLKERKTVLENDTRICVSPLKRCIQTAEILFPGYSMKIVPDFRETDFGDFEGKNYLELSGNPDYQKWIDSNGTLPFPNGEGPKEVRARVTKTFEDMLRETRECPETVEQLILVVHGGTIMTILSEYLGGDYYDYQVKNGEGYQCIAEWEQGVYRITSAEKMQHSKID